jgi:WD40 repeat protein
MKSHGARLAGAAIAALTALAVPTAADARVKPPPPPVSQNGRFSALGTIATPGRPQTIAWAPSGRQLALGGHFVEKATGKRYDTRTADVASKQLTKSYDCHYWWSIAQAWSTNPYIGEVIADGGGDHAVKIWKATSPGTTRCNPGAFNTKDGVTSLFKIDGWITSLDFSPDGRYLAGAGKDGALRIWQIAPDPDQFKLVKAWYNVSPSQFLSVRWARAGAHKGTRLVTADRMGRVAEWAFEPAADRWDEATIASVAKLGTGGQLSFIRSAAPAGRMLWSAATLHTQTWNARYSPDGAYVAGVDTGGTLTVYRAETGAVKYRVQTANHSPLHGLDWSADGALIAAGGADKTIYVFNAADGSLYDRLGGHGTLVTAVAWSPDSKTLASAAGGQLLSESLNPVSVGPDDNIRLWARR